MIVAHRVPFITVSLKLVAVEAHVALEYDRHVLAAFNLQPVATSVPDLVRCYGVV